MEKDWSRLTFLIVEQHLIYDFTRSNISKNAITKRSNYLKKKEKKKRFVILERYDYLRVVETAQLLRVRLERKR